MIGLIKKLFGAKETAPTPAVEAPSTNWPFPRPIESAPYKVPEPEATAPIPSVVETVVEAPPAKKPAAKKPATPKKAPAPKSVPVKSTVVRKPKAKPAA